MRFYLLPGVHNNQPYLNKLHRFIITKTTQIPQICAICFNLRYLCAFNSQPLPLRHPFFRRLTDFSYLLFSACLPILQRRRVCLLPASDTSIARSWSMHRIVLLFFPPNLLSCLFPKPLSKLFFSFPHPLLHLWALYLRR